MKIVLQGELDEKQIFEALKKVEFVNDPKRVPSPWKTPILPLKESVSQIVPFPSQGFVKNFIKRKIFLC